MRKQKQVWRYTTPLLASGGHWDKKEVRFSEIPYYRLIVDIFDK